MLFSTIYHEEKLTLLLAGSMYAVVLFSDFKFEFVLPSKLIPFESFVALKVNPNESVFDAVVLI